MSAEKKKQLSVLGLIVALVVVLFGSLLFVGAVAGWFDDPKVTLDNDYNCEGECDFMELSASEYDALMAERKSFVVFIDQDGCTTADRLRGYVRDWASSAGVKVYRMMFADMKETSLHADVKYYPSVVIVDKGAVRDFLRADSDEDADAYNDYGTFERWINGIVL